jgi:hypothetical protein
MCGCQGKYSYTEDGAKNFGPGYNVEDSINERSVKIMARKVLTDPAVKYEDDYAYVETDNRIRVVYFKQYDF